MPVSLSPAQVRKQQPYGIVGYKPPKKDPFAFPASGPKKLPTYQGFNPYSSTIESVPDYQQRIDKMLNVTGVNSPQSPIGGGGGVDYSSLINGDWEVQDAETAMASRLAGLRGDFRTGIRRALVDLGLTDKEKLGNFGSYIDADTIKAAAENKYSTQAQIQQQADKANAMNEARLAARGILSSGETTNQSANVLAGAEQARYKGLREFLEGGEAGLRNIADEEYGLGRQVAMARFAAAQRAAEIGGYGGGNDGRTDVGVDQGQPAPGAAPAGGQGIMNPLGTGYINKPLKTGATWRSATGQNWRWNGKSWVQNYNF